MPITVLNIVTTFIIKLAALYIVLSLVGYWEMPKNKLILLTTFSTFLGLITPVGSAMILSTITGILFRVVLFGVIVMVLTRLRMMEAFSAVIGAAVIESIILLTLSFSPFSFLTQGMSPLMVP